MKQEKLYEVSVRKAKCPIKGRPWTVAVGPNEIGAFRTEGEAEPMRSAVAGGWIATLDAEGRCCGRKPLPYKIPKPYRFLRSVPRELRRRRHADIGMGLEKGKRR